MQNKKDNLHELSIFGLKDWAEEIAEHNLGRRASGLDQILRTIVSEVKQAVEHIDVDSNLSDAGRKNKKGQLGLDALNRIEEVATEIPMIVEWVEELSASLVAVDLQPSTDPVDFLREQEIRGLVRAIPELERATILFKAIESGDSPTIRAFCHAPKAFPLVVPDVLDQAIMALTERANPDKSKEYKAAQAGLRALKAGVESARGAVSTATGVKVEDTLLKMASGL